MDSGSWLACHHPALLLEELRGKASDRKLRLFACACCLRVKDYFGDEKSLQAIEVAEQFADWKATRRELNAARRAAESLGYEDNATYAAIEAAAADAWEAAAGVARQVVYQNEAAHATLLDACGVEGIEHFGTSEDARTREYTAVASLLRDVFGNPFDRVVLNPRWLTSTVVDLAGAIYDERAFDRLPILADALMDAGCDSEALLQHCRGPGPHIRGCWVVDLLLGKE